MQRKPTTARFTLIEILIAMAILGVAIGMILSILGGSRSRILRAERNWARQHLVAQAAEWYLLTGPDAALPDGLLPKNFSAKCRLFQVELPEEAQEPMDGWVLGRYEITIYGLSREDVASITVEKLVRQEDL